MRPRPLKICIAEKQPQSGCTKNFLFYEINQISKLVFFEILRLISLIFLEICDLPPPRGRHVCIHATLRLINPKISKNANFKIWLISQKRKIFVQPLRGCFSAMQIFRGWGRILVRLRFWPRFQIFYKFTGPSNSWNFKKYVFDKSEAARPYPLKSEAARYLCSLYSNQPHFFRKYCK